MTVYKSNIKIPSEWIEKLENFEPSRLFTDEEEKMISNFIHEYCDIYKLRDLHKILQEQFPKLTWDMLRYRKSKIKNENT